MSETNRGHLVVGLGILAVSAVLGPQLAFSSFNGLDTSPIPTVAPTVEAETRVVPKRVDPNVLFDVQEANIGTVTIRTVRPFTVHLTQNCPNVRDFQVTYVDTFGTRVTTNTIRGARYDRILRYGAGSYTFDIDNLCEDTRATFRYN